MSHWSAAYLGKPWICGAAGPDAYDCWGLVRKVYQDRFGLILPPVELPFYTEQAAMREFATSKANDLWQPVDTPQDGDILLFYKGTWPVHVGVWIGQGVLHSWQASGVIITKLRAMSSIGLGKTRSTSTQ